jgi:hypothetical protein
MHAALSGWMSRKMLERYSDTRNDAKRRTADLLTSEKIGGKIEGSSPQNHPQQEAQAAASVQ